jgi:hypothetical protein
MIATCPETLNIVSTKAYSMLRDATLLQGYRPLNIYIVLHYGTTVLQCTMLCYMQLEAATVTYKART